MSNHDDLDLMLRYIYESIKRDCDHHIMMNRISLGLPPTPRSVIDETIKSSEIPFIDNESNLKGFEPGKFNQTHKLIFPIVSRGKSWFWLKMLLLERYYSEQKKIMISEMSNHDKTNLSNVIWWNYPIFLYAIGKLKEYEIDTYPDDYDWDFVFTVCRIFDLEHGKDVTVWGETLRHFGRNYTEDLKISKWNMTYVTKELCSSMSDDEINYMNHVWNDLFDHVPHTPNFNNNKPKNSWLERKTKRGK